MFDHNTIYSIITYIVHNNNIEIISLNSFQENHGIGTKLLNTVSINIFEFYSTILSQSKII